MSFEDEKYQERYDDYVYADTMTAQDLMELVNEASDAWSNDFNDGYGGYLHFQFFSENGNLNFEARWNDSENNVFQKTWTLAPRNNR